MDNKKTVKIIRYVLAIVLLVAVVFLPMFQSKDGESFSNFSELTTAIKRAGEVSDMDKEGPEYQDLQESLATIRNEMQLKYKKDSEQITLVEPEATDPGFIAFTGFIIPGLTLIFAIVGLISTIRRLVAVLKDKIEWEIGNKSFYLAIIFGIGNLIVTKFPLILMTPLIVIIPILLITGKVELSGEGANFSAANGSLQGGTLQANYVAQTQMNITSTFSILGYIIVVLTLGYIALIVADRKLSPRPKKEKKNKKAEENAEKAEENSAEKPAETPAE